MTNEISIPQGKTPFDRLMLDVAAPVLTDSLMNNPAINALVRINRQRTVHRIESFLKFLNPHSEAITEEQAIKLKEIYETAPGQEILADYIDAVTTTSSERAHLALALLLADDQEYKLTPIETQIFVNAMININDDLLTFFIATGQLKTYNNHPAYPLTGVTEKILIEMNQEKLGAEEAITFVNELIKRRLLLPEPPSGPEASDNAHWWISFGVTEMTQKFIKQLKKAEYILKSINES